MKHILLIFALLTALFSCQAILPSPNTKETTYFMKHGKLVAIPNQKDTNTLISPTKSNDIVSHYSKLQHPTFQYQSPDPRQYRVQLKDSITGYLVPDRSLPTIQMSLYFRESTTPKSVEFAAANALLDVMLRRGGSKTMPAILVDDTLEFLAASMGGSTGAFQSSLQIQCLSRDFPTVLDILTQVYGNPAFDSTRFEYQKSVYLQNIQHRLDRPQDHLSALARKSMYTSGPRLWNARPAEVSAVKTQDLQLLAASRFNPSRVVFAISGDFQNDSMATTLKKFFANWKVATPRTDKPVVLQYRNQPGVYVSDKKITQANITLQQPFVQRPHPDYYPAQVASYILGGGGFTSRLTLRIRSDEGLAYSVYSFVQSDYNEPGVAGISLQTKVESAPFALRLAFDEIRKLAKEGPTDEELESAKLSLIESIPGMFDSPTSTAENFAVSEFRGSAMDHFRDYPVAIRAVTSEQVKQCIAKYFEPSKMTISIVGPVDQLKNLSDFGTVNVIPADSLEFR